MPDEPLLSVLVPPRPVAVALVGAGPSALTVARDLAPLGYSVTVFDGATLAKIGEVAVGTGPRSIARASNGLIWVVAKHGGSLSVIDPSTREPIEPEPNERLLVNYRMRLIGGAWRVVFVEKVTL